MEILKLSNITFQYGKTSVLEGVNLSINKGEQASLLGLSGSGKTTLLRLCAGFEKPLGGQVFLREEDVTLQRCKNRKVGFVFQDYALFPHMTVKENIEYGCTNKKHKKKAEDLVKLLNLKDHLTKRPGQLSGGERQKVALTRTLCLDPDLVFLDEPFSSIDQQQTKQLVKELRRLFQNLGITSLMVTHSQYEAIDFSDRIFVLNEGKLLQSGTPAELYAEPNSDFVADFFGTANWLKGKAKGKQVETELGTHKLKDTLKKTNCKVLIRPEDLQLNKSGEGLDCQVLGQAYRFDRWLIDVKTPKGQVFAVDCPKPWGDATAKLKLKSSNDLQAF